MVATTLDILASTAWTTFLTEQLPVEVIGHVGLELLEDLLQQDDILLVVADHLLYSFSLPTQDPQPQVRVGMDLLTETEELPQVIETVTIEIEIGLRHLFRVNSRDWGEWGELVEHCAGVQVWLIERVPVVMDNHICLEHLVAQLTYNMFVVVGIPFVALRIV